MGSGLIAVNWPQGIRRFCKGNVCVYIYIYIRRFKFRDMYMYISNVAGGSIAHDDFMKVLQLDSRKFGVRCMKQAILE